MTPPNYARIEQLRAELTDELGCAVIIWTFEDFPGKDEDEQQKRFCEFVDPLCDTLISQGNATIAMEYGGSDDEGA